ncbi:MAG: 3-hydroxyacyl-CoA dehydrogenase [Ferruginibacter sp.]|nr:3-hydroxyacyl-CoA dehydrogenase [Ferruginibacter sp.]
MAFKDASSPVLLIGSGKLTYSICVCLLQAQHTVTLVTSDKNQAVNYISAHFHDLSKLIFKGLQSAPEEMTGVNKPGYSIAIAITAEDLAEKRAAIQLMEKNLIADSIIAINTESIPLCTLQEACLYPKRLIGVNWVEPAHVTYFLEIIINGNTDKTLVDILFNNARANWNKDPYLVSHSVSIRAKMFCAMAREAFFLVKNGYASIEDIDRACRNDAGYYLPFSGNFRYMDLMGTYAYGLVMEDLNRELSKDSDIPDFLKNIIGSGGLGMENNQGFYKYENGDAKRWNHLFIQFSYQIHHIIEKYPFNYTKKAATAVKQKILIKS